MHDIAREERVTSDYLYIVLRLRWLARERQNTRDPNKIGPSRPNSLEIRTGRFSKRTGIFGDQNRGAAMFVYPLALNAAR